ncbi:hypothetical protein I926_00375 [Pasteurella multocida subsp. multocida OH4807]|nr:hypothetical protein I926_00375 [Pasteurella multocida subsp. multocida OH4807]
MIKPSDLIQRAEFLNKQSTELEWRDGIKHAYYYLYHLVKDFVEENRIGMNVERDHLGEHQYLIERIRSMDNNLAKSLAREMQMLKDKRTLCCYNLNEEVTKIMLFQQIMAAKNARMKLDKLCE